MAHVFLICGHGAGDSGAVGNGYQEQERVRTLGARIKALGGDYVTLADTSKNWYKTAGINTLTIPKDWQIIELHMDSGASSARGGHVIIKQGYTADKYDNALAKMLKEILPGRSNMIVGRGDLANVNRAAAKGYGYRLVEFGFISNANDVKIFNSRMDDIAEGVLEAFDIPTKRIKQIPGKAKNDNQLWYRAHCQNLGWLDPVHDGQISGTTGFSTRMEALLLDIRKIREENPNAKLSGDFHVQNIGTVHLDNIEPDTLIGTIGKSLRLEAFRLHLTGVPDKKLYYEAHVQDIGWQGKKADGEVAGTTGQSLRIEAVRIWVE
ncbi:N-acetylmuramoyl-L-alanine amidase [Bariatricus sp. HCP28S3_E4]|uniref:N-acetylmuramoyl-L-alanine amidase n=1 Tax=unclassified Bariatricus TaxID=2677046 RepID=UPI003F8C7A48